MEEDNKNNSLDERINEMLVGLPAELALAVRARADFWKSKMPALSEDEVLAEVRSLVRLEMLAYLDRREYLGMYNRRFVEHKIAEAVREVVSKAGHEEHDLYSIARINFDVNGLKALNDLGGHEAGNKGLKMFANILNYGKTTLWLRDELGLEVTTSAEGGDEFGAVLKGAIDLRQYKDEIIKRYTDEVYESDASSLINFTDSGVQEKISMLGIASDVPADFKFRLSTSVGLALFGEAIALIDMQEGSTFTQMIRNIMNALFALADDRGSKHKSEFKRALADTDPILSGLYARMSREVIHLERELKVAKAKILQLENELEKLAKSK